jgi:hypothetical protein
MMMRHEMNDVYDYVYEGLRYEMTATSSQSSRITESLTKNIQLGLQLIRSSFIIMYVGALVSG